MLAWLVVLVLVGVEVLDIPGGVVPLAILVFPAVPLSPNLDLSRNVFGMTFLQNFLDL